MEKTQTDVYWRLLLPSFHPLVYNILFHKVGKIAVDRDKLNIFKITSLVDGREHEISQIEMSSIPLALEEAFLRADCRSSELILLKLKTGKSHRREVDKINTKSSSDALEWTEETDEKCVFIESVEKYLKGDILSEVCSKPV